MAEVQSGSRSGAAGLAGRAPTEDRADRVRSTRLRTALRATPAFARRHAIVGPIALVTGQMLVDFLYLELPARASLRVVRNPRRLHRLLSAHGAYSDLYTEYWMHHLYLHPLPYLQARIEYPVLLGAFMTAAAALTHNLRSYFELSSVGLYACAVCCVVCLWTLSRRSAWIFSICPLLLVFSLLNWDLFAIALMLCGWVAYRRDRYVAAAVLLTLGTFAKLYPVFLLVFCAIELLRRWRDHRLPAAKALGYLFATIATSLVVNLPFALLAFRNWSYFFRFNTERNQFVSIVYFLHLLSPHDSPFVANAVFAGVVGVAVLGGAAAVWRRADVARVAAVVFAVFLLMQKVYSPQYTLWLVPFALIASWQVWSVALLGMLGLGNYSSASVNIYLRWRFPEAAQWFARNVEPLERDVRLSVITAVAVASILGPLLAARLRRAPRGGPPQVMEPS